MHRSSVNLRLPTRWLAVSLAVFGLCACGDDSSPPGDDVDSSMPMADLGPTDRDLGPTPPPVPPPPVDAGPSPVDADTGPCDTEGMTRTVPCGRCGLASQTCTAGRWGEATECFDEGECAAGEVERIPPTCGDQRRICDEACAWRPYEGSFSGECMPGTTRMNTATCPDGGYVMEVCREDCSGWNPIGACIDGCSRSAHASRSSADPVCIPAGPFILGTEIPGDDRYLNARPQTEVILSEFYVDRHPVTFARLSTCVDDGACLVDLPDPPREVRSFWQVTATEARQFCAWDGGALIDEFQWEKAARGFAPDDRAHSWGDDDLGMDAHMFPGDMEAYHADRYPAAVSPFGVRHLGSASELTGSFPILDYTSLPLTDPSYPATDDTVVLRGFTWASILDSFTAPNTASLRERAGDRRTIAYFRCVY